MTLHDAYARLTPFEVLFRNAEEAGVLAAAVAEEAEGRGVDIDDPHAFATLGTVAAFIGEVQGDALRPETRHGYGVLAWHALRFARAGLPLYLLGTPAARLLVGEGSGEVAPPPSPSGYLQLPQHLFWSEGPAVAPESVDGVFWSVTARAELHVLMVTGMRPDRSSLGVIPLPRAPAEEASSWIGLDARGDGSDFSSSMPGSELAALYAFRTSGEVLKLLARWFAYASMVPSALVTEPAFEGVSPVASTFPFTRVTLPG
jgi:hypothetical protein